MLPESRLRISKPQLVSEATGTAFLLIAIVGSGIMGEQLAGGNVGLALLANSIATGAALIALISAFGSISSHFNPVATVMFAARKGLDWRNVITLIFVQVCGAVAGVAL
ncbi:MAG TPA: aquaporin, partial [Terriglobia bacterium]|nr:aquaporin [Terriglobia bacterium]